MTVTEEEAQVMLDELTARLVGRGFVEKVEFVIDGRTQGSSTSTMVFVGFSDGRFRAWYRDTGETSVFVQSEDLADVEPKLVEVLKRERDLFRGQPWGGR